MVVPELVAQKLEMEHPYGSVGVTKYTVSGRGDSQGGGGGGEGGLGPVMCTGGAKSAILCGRQGGHALVQEKFWLLK